MSTSQFVQVIPRLTKIKNFVYGSCQLGKLKYISHQKVDSPYTIKSLELIHIYLMGPIKTESFGGKHYIFLVVDDFFRLSLLFCIKI